jgi:superfamily II DNA/RNA helicase
VIERGYLVLKDLRMLILDEADQICKRKCNEKAFKQFEKI